MIGKIKIDSIKFLITYNHKTSKGIQIKKDNSKTAKLVDVEFGFILMEENKKENSKVAQEMDMEL